MWIRPIEIIIQKGFLSKWLNSKIIHPDVDLLNIGVIRNCPFYHTKMQSIE